MYRARSSSAASPTSSVTLRSVIQAPAYLALSSPFISLPASLRGRLSTKRTILGALKPAIFDFTNAMISCSSSGPGTAPGAGWTNAATDSPISGSGTPMTATS